MLEKIFLQPLSHHFPPSNKLHKIFKNTVKVSYFCTQTVSSIIKSHNKKLINTSMKNILSCNCRKKHECSLYGKCRAENIVYKCVASIDGYPNKVYLGTAEGDFRVFTATRYHSITRATPDTTLSKYGFEIKEKLKIMPSLKWSIIKSIPAYSDISKKCLCLQEKIAITLIQINCLIEDQSLFQSAATLTSVYCGIINLMTRPYGKCPIR